MAKVKLSLACWNYDRTRALLEGRVRPEGIDLTYLDLPVEETFFRMLRHREFDVAEMSLSSYTLSLFREKRHFVAIPVFPSRFFRHSCIYVNRESGIREPRDLIGKQGGQSRVPDDRAGVDRGILQDEYGVSREASRTTRAARSSRASEKLKLDLPRGIKVKPIGPRETLAAMLRDGDRRVLHGAHAVDVRRPRDACGGYSRTTWKSRRPTSARRASSRSCTRS